MSKPKLALYWAASCGGCEVAVLDVAEKILDVAGFFDIVFWPCAMDFKYKDVEAMADGSIDLCLFNGAIRNSENESMAHLLRRKAKVLVAFGSCAMDGCIPGLANLTTREEILESSYQQTPSTLNPEGTRPLPLVAAPEGELDIPEFYESVQTLAQVVPVDYFIPGCPPQPTQILNGDVRDHAGSGTAARGVCDRGRREDLLRGMRPSPERKTSQALLPGLGD